MEITSVESEVLRQAAIERERRRLEPHWCCRVTHANGSMPVNLHDVPRGVVDDAILAAVHAWPSDPNRGFAESTRVDVWQLTPPPFGR